MGCISLLHGVNCAHDGSCVVFIKEELNFENLRHLKGMHFILYAVVFDYQMANLKEKSIYALLEYV